MHTVISPSESHLTSKELLNYAIVFIPVLIHVLQKPTDHIYKKNKAGDKTSIQLSEWNF